MIKGEERPVIRSRYEEDKYAFTGIILATLFTILIFIYCSISEVIQIVVGSLIIIRRCGVRFGRMEGGVTRVAIHL